MTAPALPDAPQAGAAAAPRKHRSLSYMPGLDGLRGIGLVCLLLYHGDWQKYFSGGYLWLSMFFTLSGFLITSLLLVELYGSGTIDLRTFWVRRLRRLMPAAILGVALGIVFVVAAGSASQTSRLLWDGLSSLFYFSNFRFMGAGHSYWEMFSRPSPLQPYWSLSIEEQFYVVYPLLLLGITALAGVGPRPLRIALIALTLLSTGVMVTLSLAGASPARLYYGTDTRAAEFLAGAVLAAFLVRDGGIQPWQGRGSKLVTAIAVAFAALAIFLVPEDSPFVYRGGFALYAVASALIVNATMVPGIVQRVLSLEPLPWMGATSYGVYVYHWPIYLYLDSQRTGLSGLPLMIVQIAATVAVAAASKRWIEVPIRRETMLRGVRAAIAAPVAAVAVTALLFVVSNSEIDAWHPGMGNKIAEMPELGPPAPVGPTRVLIVGDSLAWNIGMGVIKRYIRHPEQVTAWNLAQWGCGLVRNSKVKIKEGETMNACLNWPDFWEQAVDRFRPDLVIIVAGAWDLRRRVAEGWTEIRGPGDPVFDDWLLGEYRLAVDITSSHGARVVWVNAPCTGPVPPDSLLANDNTLDPAHIEYFNNVLLPALAASRPGRVEIFDLFAAVCPDGRYKKSLDGVTIARSDFLHLSDTMSANLAGKIVTRFAPPRPTAATGGGAAAPSGTSDADDGPDVVAP